MESRSHELDPASTKIRNDRNVAKSWSNPREQRAKCSAFGRVF